MNNNSFYYRWTDGSSVSVVLPNGGYDVSDVNTYLQSVMIKNGHYLINANGSYVYYITMQVNPSLYSTQINFLPLPSSLPLNWVNPSSTTTAMNGFAPQFGISSNAFTKWIGFSSAGLYPAASSTGTFSYFSNSCPVINPVSAVTITTNCICTKRGAVPNNILTGFSGGGVTFTSNIFYQPSNLIFSDMNDGFYQQLIFNINQQDGVTPLGLIDSAIVLNIAIQDKN